MFDYFACRSDEEAASVIDWVGGPSSPPDPKRTFLRRTPDRVGPYPTVQLPGIDPVVMMATLEALLTGSDAMEIIHESAADVIAERNGGEQSVVPLRNSLQDALRAATEQELRTVAVPWSQTEEFFGDGDPEILAGALIELAALMKEAQRAESRVYCWVCV
jgi:hypothetical protein